MKKKKLIYVILIIVIAMLTLTSCIEGDILKPEEIFANAKLFYLEPIDDEGTLDFEKPTISDLSIEDIQDNLMPMRKYSYINLEWNHIISDKYEFTVFVFDVTTDEEMDFVFEIMSDGTNVEDAKSEHTVKCTPNVPTSIALALGNIHSEGIYSQRLSIVNLRPEQMHVQWKISSISIGGIEKSGVAKNEKNR